MLVSDLAFDLVSDLVSDLTLCLGTQCSHPKGFTLRTTKLESRSVSRKQN
eukprot:gene16719-716_t